MKKYFSFVYFTLLLVPITDHACQYQNIFQLTKCITKKRCASHARYKKQIALITALRTTAITHELTDPCLDALLYDNNFPLLSEYSTTINSGLPLLADTPNFLSVLRTALTHLEYPEVAKGYFYEIDQAAHIAQNTNEEVLALSWIYQSDDASYAREFDIITDTHWYECKNIKWKKHNKKMKQQFLDQKSLVEEYNAIYDDSIIFAVRSKNSIPRCWCNWFTAQDIEAIEA